MPSICGKRCAAPTSLAFDGTAGSDEVFRALVLARIIEPTSKLDSARVLEEAGVEAFSYRASCTICTSTSPARTSR